MLNKKIILMAVLLMALLYFFSAELNSLATLKTYYADIHSWQQRYPLLFAAVFILFYILCTALALPLATLLSLLAGALFGNLWGSIIVSFAATIGASLAFSIARHLLRAPLQRRFAKLLAELNRGIERDGDYYLLSLRLLPIVPFFLVNLVMAQTKISLGKFYICSQIGMLPATLVYVNAGRELATIQSLRDILSLKIFVALSLLALLPWCIKLLLGSLHRRRHYRQFSKPKKYDANLIVIGAGAAGLVNAYIAALLRAKVVLIEADKMGGDCLNSGCVPSKALIYAAQQGWSFAEAMQYVQHKIAAVAPHDSQERYTKLGVNCITGHATLVSPWTVAVGQQTISARRIVIATGAQAYIPPIAGIATCKHFSSANFWQLQSLPPRLLIIGAGAIGCELAQCMARFGSQVTILESAAKILASADDDVSRAVHKALTANSVVIKTNITVDKFTGNCCHFHDTTCSATIEFDAVLFATGRRAQTQNLGLENIGIKLAADGKILVDKYMHTGVAGIYAAGDVVNKLQLTNAAAHSAWYSSVNALFAGCWQFKNNNQLIPRAIFTQPQVAQVGLSETSARAANIKYKLSRYDLTHLDRAIIDDCNYGFVKVLTKPNSDKILGVTIVAEHASEMLSEFSLAMQHGLGLSKIMTTNHIYPSFAEANKFVAAQFKQQQVRAWQLALLQKFHKWRL